MQGKDERGVIEELIVDLELNQVVGSFRDSPLLLLPGKADIYMFDEPSSYLDVKQRLKAAKVIRSLIRPDSYVIDVEHDLSVLDYLSDHISCSYGKPPGAFGAVTLPFSVREGLITLDLCWVRHGSN
ncbi:PREDICTED: ABC transporter [Prunus dulcis]|uniref:PREDICTED: ABC transporter n=1 Tax=Prunus dulcis TaxID=3755 RepID=A0A5E4F8J9_PRUDU|nr:ABC transporter E family member 1-like [Prunus dulcis]VVA24032.1 PREDICTED: ABC transporter [Prunus dulcis]